jgi:hypothetical protein
VGGLSRGLELAAADRAQGARAQQLEQDRVMMEKLGLRSPN